MEFPFPYKPLTDIFQICLVKMMSDFTIQNFYIPVEQKKFTRLTGCEIKCMRPIFKTEMLIYQSKANLDKKILLGKITHQFRPRK